MSHSALMKRFIAVLRHEGPIAALRKGGRYVVRRIMGEGPTTVLAAGNGMTQGPEHYLHGIWQTLAREEAFHVLQSPGIDRRRRQIAMIADLNLPQCRKYRVEQLASFWRNRGVEFEFAHYEDVPRATRIMQHATHLMEYRLKTTAAAEMLRYEARRLRLPVLYDLDDPLFSVSAYETYQNMDAVDSELKRHFVAEAPKYLSMMNGADILSVSTPGMAEHVARYSGRPVYLRRNFADDETLQAGNVAMKQKPEDDGLFRVAFASGSQGHEVDLNEIMAPLAEFILDDPRRRLLLIGHFDPAYLPDGLPQQTERMKFATYDRYLAALSHANAAIMPLCDDAFNRCKSAVRVLDASAVAVPSIVGSVGDQPNVVRCGKTGFVSGKDRSWVDTLRELAENPEAARRMGQAARSELETRWCGSAQPHIIAPELIEWVEA